MALIRNRIQASTMRRFGEMLKRRGRFLCPSSLVGRAVSSSVSSEDRYIQHSQLPTMHFQPGLMRLPIPKLNDTCARYTAALQPVAPSPQAFTKAQEAVQDFQREGGIGHVLQGKLVLDNRKNKHTSYISKPWFDMYLSDRKSIVLNYNPFIAFKEDPATTDQAMRAANFIWSTVRFRSALLDGCLAPEVYHLNPMKSDTEQYRNIMRWVPQSLSCYASMLWKAFPLDMSQYNRLFNTTRLPVRGCDELVTHSSNCQHVLVLRNGNMYTLQAVQDDGLPVSCQTLYNQLQGILADKTAPSSHPLGYLTTLNRDKWAELREEVQVLNSEQLAAIDSSILVLCLDDSEPTTADSMFHTMLHNYGANRWFDKSIQLIVSKGAQAAINFEHSWGDGVAVLRFFEEIYKDKKHYSSTCEPTMEGVARLHFNLSPQITSAIEEAKRDVEEQCKSLSVGTLQYKKFGKDYIKKKTLSPDAFFQLAIQIAYYRQFKKCVPTYESCSTAAFKHGRTETIRPASRATKLCVEAFEASTTATPEELMQLITQATNHHSKLVKEAALGQGFDRHLFALKNIAEKMGFEAALFEDECYSYMNEIILSTSTLPSDSVLLGGFAPVSPRGYGVGYGIMQDWLGAQITTYPTCNGDEVIYSLEQVLDDMFAVLNGEKINY